MAESHNEISRVDDYAAHKATYDSFKVVIRLAMIHLGLLAIGLYWAVIAGQGWLGLFFILAAVVVPIGMGVARRV